MSIRKVFLKCSEHGKKFSDAVWNLLGMTYIVVSLVMVIQYADCYIVRHCPKIAIFVFGLSFAKLVV